jgi:uncharacterized membrane protein
VFDSDVTHTSVQSGRSSPWRISSSRYRLLIALGVGLLAALVTLLLGGKELAPMIGWDCTAITFMVWVWLTVWPMNSTTTKKDSLREDPTRASTDVLILTASIGSLAAVALVLVLADSAQGAAKVALAGLAIISVATSWLIVHTLFTLRYALLYYRAKPPGGIDFKQDEPPQYSDFAYVALTLGMTFQVSDTDLKTTSIRATALRQALISYLFGAVILATTINLIAGLGSSSG